MEGGAVAPEGVRPRRVVLLSTYDLGRQPFALASAAAWLRRAGAEVRTLDLAVENLDEDAIHRADLVAFHLPMHTATRLAIRRLPRVRELNPRAALCAFGLYAPANAAVLRSFGVGALIGGEFEAALTALVGELAAAARDGRAPRVARAITSFERLDFLVPDRSGLAPLEAYARLEGLEGGPRLVGYTEASRGCAHRCRHCPVVPVYDGRVRIVPRAVVLEDIDRQVAMGARHVTFGDPDFWNGIGHAMPLVRELHRRHPALSFDVTIKIEHLLRHRAHLAELRACGALFVTSAVEAVDDAILERLDKGHTRAGFEEAVGLCRAAGLCLHPTFVAFTPWTTRTGYLAMLEAIERLELVEQVAPIQLVLRLLVPAGSRLLELEEVRRRVGRFDPDRLCHPWDHPDPAMDGLQRELEALVAGRAGEDRRTLFEAVRARAEAVAGIAAGGRDARAERMARAARAPKRPPVPFLTEPWYC